VEHTYWHAYQSTPIGTPIRGHLLEHMRCDTPIGAGLVEHTYWNTYQSTPIGKPLRAHLLEHLSEDPCRSTCDATHLLEQA